jgi:hypothetical protein
MLNQWRKAGILFQNFVSALFEQFGKYTGQGMSYNHCGSGMGFPQFQFEIAKVLQKNVINERNRI